jgi:hypothetical protein
MSKFYKKIGKIDERFRVRCITHQGHAKEAASAKNKHRLPSFHVLVCRYISISSWTLIVRFKLNFHT